MTAELVEFLLACIADDEAAERRKWRRLKDDEVSPEVRARYRDVVTVHYGYPYGDGLPVGEWSNGRLMSPSEAAEWRELTTAPSPDRRMLAECESKRRIIEMCARASDDYYLGFHADETLKLLGLPFSDRPGYRQEWTP